MATAKKLYWFQTFPGDVDRLGAASFASGVIRADPAEVDALKASLKRHEYEYRLDLLAGDLVGSLDDFRSALGNALSTYHSEAGSEPCVGDLPFIERANG